MQFCILHKPMGGARAPPAPPGYATAFGHKIFCKREKIGVEDTTFEAKDKKISRPRTDFLKTDPLEAKNRNVRGQGLRTQGAIKCSPRRKKRSPKIFSGDLKIKRWSSSDEAPIFRKKKDLPNFFARFLPISKVK